MDDIGTITDAVLTKGTMLLYTARFREGLVLLTRRAPARRGAWLQPVGPRRAREAQNHHFGTSLRAGRTKFSQLQLSRREDVQLDPRHLHRCDVQIEMPSVTVGKRYFGPKAFQAFLREFMRGERTFQSRDFRNQQMELERVGIRTIAVKYEFGGAVGGALKHGEQEKKPTTTGPPPAQPFTIPTRIVTCWDQ